jgi:hypothetical protein
MENGGCDSRIKLPGRTRLYITTYSGSEGMCVKIAGVLPRRDAVGPSRRSTVFYGPESEVRTPDTLRWASITSCGRLREIWQASSTA